MSVHGEVATTTPEIVAIQQLFDVMNSAVAMNQAARTLATHQAVRAANDDLIAQRAAVRNDFAGRQGWIFSKRGFTLEQLRRGSTQSRRGDCNFQVSPMDHVEYFRFAERPWHPVAILSHEYGQFEDSEALGSKFGLVAKLLPTSWYAPGRANAVLYLGFYSLCL